MTVRVSQRSVVYGGAATLSGAVSSGAAGEHVTIAGVGVATTRAGGGWSFAVRPARSTTYRVSWSTAPPAAVTVIVAPRVTVSVARRVLAVRVAAAASLAGRRVALQRRDGKRWAFVSWLRLATGSRVTTPLPRRIAAGSLVRVVVPKSAGYATGVGVARVK